MYEAARETWKDYSTLLASRLAEDDVRCNLAAEVRTRLGQLDLLLEKLEEASAVLRADPDEIERVNRFAQDNYAALDRGELSIEDWITGTTLSQKSDPKTLIRTWESIVLFTEAFYFFAWRLKEALNGHGKYAFPHLQEIKAKGVRIVRNDLLQHPEKVKDSPNFTQGLTMTSNGPVLRSVGMVLRGDGRTLPIDDTVDVGLFVTAAQFRDELLTKFERAVAALPPTS